MPARCVAIGIVLLLAACGRTEFVSPLVSPLTTVPSPLATPTVTPNGILSPAPHSVVQGRVEIIGTATHPEFERYELFFSPCPVSGVEWCSIGDAAFQPVQSGVLGVWHTITIPNGTYQIQLRVVRRGGNYETFIVDGVTVANAPYLTATPQPTWTPSPTYTPTSPPTIIPPIHTPVAGQLPRITYDLLFLGKYGLMRWNHGTGQIEALVTPEARQGRGWQSDQNVAWLAGRGGPGGGGIGPFSVSADGQKVAFVRLTPARVNAYLYEIALLDMRTGQITVLVPAQGRGLSGMALSPDGRWVAYLLPDALPGAELPPPGRGSGLAVPVARPMAGGGLSSGTIYAVRTSAPYDRIEVGYCAKQVTEAVRLDCGGFRWAPDSQAIAWNDAHGIWIAELGRPGQLLLPHDPYGLGGRLFRLSNWSPRGRYALVVAGIYETDAGSYGVIDTQTGRMADLLPISLGPGPHITWMQDGRVMSSRPGDRLSGAQPAAEIWSVDAGRDPMLSREIEFSFDVGAENFPTSPTQLNDGRLAFALLNENNTNYIERGLYIVDLNDLIPRKVNGLPPAYDDRLLMDALWSPDGTGAIVQEWSSSERMLWYVPADGSPLMDLRPVMDEGDFRACCFVWTR